MRRKPNDLRRKRNGRKKMARAIYNIVGSGIHATQMVLVAAVKAVQDTDVQVAPFNDKYLAKVGVWIRGEADEVKEVLERLKKELKETEYNALRWEGAMERG